MGNELLNSYDVVVLGAGAAGLMCAFTAAKRGRSVLVVEKSNKAGKKILMSGGGRCNFTNHFVEASNFISTNPHFCKSALNRYTQWDFIAMVESHGIKYEERKHSQLFCINSAKDILAMLLKECAIAGVTIKTRCELKQVRQIETNPAAKHYKLTFLGHGNEPEEDFALKCESLVVASGALSIPTLGGSDIGYDIARQFSLPLIPQRAGLVPFTFSDTLKPICERLSGLATEVEISCNNMSFTENILFTHRGLSGPAVLQISNYWESGDTLHIDLLPGIKAGEWLIQLKQNQGKSLLRTALNQKLAKALVNELQTLWWDELKDDPLARFSDKKLDEIGDNLNHWRIKPSGTEGYRTAEVTLGGVDTSGISSKTMEAKQYSGLYFIGEVLDVTGHLGGFNFQWAWSSGYAAGEFA
jgi:predicted Rossmann fold flavoprotein